MRFLLPFSEDPSPAGTTGCINELRCGEAREIQRPDCKGGPRDLLAQLSSWCNSFLQECYSHVRVVKGPPYFLQDSNRHKRPTVKTRNNSPGLPCILPCLGPWLSLTEREDLEKHSHCSGDIQGHLRCAKK